VGAVASFPAGDPNGNDDAVGDSGTPIDPRFDVLADEGGPTPTHAPMLELGSAIDPATLFRNGFETGDTRYWVEVS
jgi:hypothetical protein